MKKYIKPDMMLLSIENESFLASLSNGDELKISNSVSDMAALSKEQGWFQELWNDDGDAKCVDENM